MAGLRFSIADLFEKTHGYKTKAFDPKFSPVIGDGDGSDAKNPLSNRVNWGASGAPYYANDALGREYYMPVTVFYPEEKKSSEEEVSKNSEKGTLISWNLPFPVISISSKKTIVETPLTERGGTVKEMICMQDYEIIIKGFIIGTTNEFPEHDVTILRTIYEQNRALSIRCPLTDIFLAQKTQKTQKEMGLVVIRELKFPVIPGVKNVRPYELHMVSDEPFNLISIT